MKRPPHGRLNGLRRVPDNDCYGAFRPSFGAFRRLDRNQSGEMAYRMRGIERRSDSNVRRIHQQRLDTDEVAGIKSRS